MDLYTTGWIKEDVPYAMNVKLKVLALSKLLCSPPLDEFLHHYKVAWLLELSRTGPFPTANITNPVCVVYSLAGGSFSIDDYSPM